MNTLATAIVHYSSSLYNKQEYHTSALTGHAWVLELLTGHPDRIRCELGVRHHVFDQLITTLREQGCQDSREVTLEEQLSIFLYTCVTGLTVRHVGERFQRANNTIAKYVIQLECSELFAYSHLFCCRYFKEMLAIFSSPPFYNKYVRMPNVNDPIPPEI